MDDNIDEIVEVAETLTHEIANAITKIAHGPTTGPTGLEMLAISICGDGKRDGSVAGGLKAIAEAIDNLSDNLSCRK